MQKDWEIILFHKRRHTKILTRRSGRLEPRVFPSCGSIQENENPAAGTRPRNTDRNSNHDLGGDRGGITLPNLAAVD
jgi:hypothetical protein